MVTTPPALDALTVFQELPAADSDRSALIEERHLSFSSGIPALTTHVNMQDA